jgi:hypothetical protein
LLEKRTVDGCQLVTVIGDFVEHIPLTHKVVKLVGRGKLLQSLSQLIVELGLGFADLLVVCLHVPASM